MKYLITVALLASLMACQAESAVPPSDLILDKIETELVEKMNSEETTTQHKVEVRLVVPDSTWSMQIVNVIQTQDQIAVFCELKQSDMMGLMVISEVVDAVEFTAKNLAIKNYVKGKTWNWESKGSDDYVTEFPNLKGKEILFTRVTASAPGGPKKQAPGTLL